MWRGSRLYLVRTLSSEVLRTRTRMYCRTVATLPVCPQTLRWCLMSELGAELGGERGSAANVETCQVC